MLIKLIPAKGSPIIVNFDRVAAIYLSSDERVLWLQMCDCVMSNLGVVAPVLGIKGVWKNSAKWMEDDILDAVKNNTKVLVFDKERVESYKTKYFEPF